MSESATPPSVLPFADRVVLVATDKPFRWLLFGWRDFQRGRTVSFSYGLIFVVIGLVMAGVLFGLHMEYLLAPLVAGFMLVGPALTIGLHAISRDLEAGREPSLRSALTAWRGNAAPIAGMGLALVAFLVLWMRFAALIFALSFSDAGFDVQRAFNTMLFTSDGLEFLGFGTLVGAVMASIAFAAGAFSLPLMLDRKATLIEALATSVVAVVLNARAMAVWAALIVVFTGAGLACGLVGLAVTLPLVGHASWHAYRAVIRPAG